MSKITEHDKKLASHYPDLTPEYFANLRELVRKQEKQRHPYKSTQRGYFEGKCLHCESENYSAIGQRRYYFFCWLIAEQFKCEDCGQIFEVN